MERARYSAEYDLAAWLGHIIANCHRAAGQTPYRPAQFHPETAGRAAGRNPNRLNSATFARFRRFLLGPAAAPTPTTRRSPPNGKSRI